MTDTTSTVIRIYTTTLERLKELSEVNRRKLVQELDRVVEEEHRRVFETPPPEPTK